MKRGNLIYEESNLINDAIYEILLRADLETIRQYCMTHKNNLCKDDSFWKNKLKDKVDFGENLPSIYIDDIRTVEGYMDILEIKDMRNLWKALYQNMKKAKNTAEHILLINKIEKTSKFNRTDGIIIIELYDSYEYDGSDTLINILADFDVIIDNYSANYVRMTLYENNYKFKFTGLNLKTKDLDTYTEIVNEDKIIRILTLILFDSYTLFDIDIQDNRGKTFLPNIRYNVPNIRNDWILAGRQRIWDTLKYLNI